MNIHNELSQVREDEIRNRLEHIGSNLYHDVVVYEDMAWAHKTIKDLLFMLYMKEKGSVSSRGEPLH